MWGEFQNLLSLGMPMHEHHLHAQHPSHCLSQLDIQHNVVPSFRLLQSPGRVCVSNQGISPSLVFQYASDPRLQPLVAIVSTQIQVKDIRALTSVFPQNPQLAWKRSQSTSATSQCRTKMLHSYSCFPTSLSRFQYRSRSCSSPSCISRTAGTLRDETSM